MPASQEVEMLGLIIVLMSLLAVVANLPFLIHPGRRPLDSRWCDLEAPAASRRG